MTTGPIRWWGRWWLLTSVLVGCGPDVPVMGSGGDTDDAEDAGTVEEAGDETEMSPDLPPEVPDPFEGARMLELTVPASKVAFGDYDDDGADDAIFSYTFEYGTTGYSQDLLEIMRFDPESESFEQLLQQEAGRIATQLVPAHVDGDGRLDVLFLWTSTMSQIAIRDDDIEIGPTIDIAGPLLGKPIDFDGDRRADYVGIYGSTIRTYTVDLMGGWVETQALAFEASCTPVRAEWRDLTDDGRLDMLVVGQCSDRTTLTTYAQAEDGTLSIVAESEASLPLSDVAVADFDDDGRLDVALGTARYEEGAPPPEATVLAGLGDGSFGDELLHLHSSAEYGNIAIRAVDLDGDGVDEPLVANYGDVLDPSLASGWALTQVEGSQLVVHPLPFDVRPSYGADLDGDGCEEMVSVGGETLVAVFLPCE